jgi:hypothetical protein
MTEKPGQKSIEKIEAYRRVFDTRDGLFVLEDMLNDLEYFNTIETEEARILHNYAVSLLLKLGSLQHFNQEEITKSLLKLPFIAPVGHSE